MTSSHVRDENIGPDGYLQPNRYRVHARCNLCGETFSWVTTKLNGKDRPCPRRVCKDMVFEMEVERRAANLNKMLDERRAPGHIGESVRVKAIDTTAEIVMQDYEMTNLQDNIRTGDAVAPKLPGPMQAAADNYFGGNALKDRGIGSRQAELLGRRAMAGAFRGMAINPGNVVPGQSGESALRSVGSEKLKG